MHILLVVPYFGGSHRAWAEGYARHSRHQVELLTLPARFWKWRMQGGAVTLVEALRERDLRPDLLLVTDMLNLPTFLGLARDRLAKVPVALYAHENQLTYPLPPGERRDLTYGVMNWLSMLAADRVFFNSRYHLEDWFDELPRCLKHFPDFTHLHRVPEVCAKSAVLPVGIDLARLDRARREPTKAAPPLVLWNQRWEYDKDPQTFFRALYALADADVPFRVALAGVNVRQQPEEFEIARARLGERVVHYGRAAAETYARLLWEADVVVSTALHEFFGIAVIEAMYCHSFPVLPRRLVYPELVPEVYHNGCLYDDFDGLVTRLRWALTHVAEARQIGEALRSTMARFTWTQVAPRYDAALEKMASRD
ncbi:MAG: tRNA-queuosine alpha-mannosyltransferase domain-containing protein [Anaerolineae bacterium]